MPLLPSRKEDVSPSRFLRHSNTHSRWILVLLAASRLSSVHGLMLPLPLPVHQSMPVMFTEHVASRTGTMVYLPQSTTISSVSSVWSSLNLASLETDIAATKEEPSLQQSLQKDLQKNSKQYKSDTVVRILDANTIKLEKAGLVALAGVQTPSTGGFPECTDTSPSKQLRKSLPKGMAVKIRLVNDNSNESPSAAVRRAIIVRETNSGNSPVLVNAELIESGYAKPVARGRQAAEQILPGFSREMEALNRQAQTKHVGLYQTCNADDNSSSNNDKLQQAKVNFDDQFEPLAFTTQTKWGVDGGKTILVDNTLANSNVKPKNPGDVKGCSDFDTYEEALSWYEMYQPYYGDVAKLDRDGDGVPCPKLPHTKNMDRFRRKVPTNQQL